MNTKPTQTIVFIPVKAIEVVDRLRPVDPDHVALIAESVREQGVRHPIEVRPLADGRYGLISGAHRLAAAEKLGMASIPAVVKEVDALARELLEVDENLCRFDLHALDKAVFLARRKELYQQLNPDTKRGRHSRAAATEARQQKLLFSPGSFAKDVAKRVGISARAVDQSVRRAAIIEDLRVALAGTRIARRGCDLDVLANLDANDQGLVARLLSNPVWATKPIRQVIAAATGEPEPEKKSAVERLLAGAARLNTAQRAAFLKGFRALPPAADAP